MAVKHQMNHYFCEPKEIWQKDSKTLCIIWTDNIEQEFDVVKLRQQCPCASCQEQQHRVSCESIRPKSIKSMGSYAIKIEFNDGHHKGIYTFKYLRENSFK